MMFVNSIKLFGSNWVKVLKFLLYYVVIWGLCFALFLPVFFEFKDLVSSNFQSADMFSSFSGVFQGALGTNLHNIMQTSYLTLIDVFKANLGLAIYGLIVVFVFLPFFINVGKYALNEMLYSYMTSKAKVGFFSALVKSLKKSVPFALCKTFYNILFFAITLAIVYGIGLVEDAFFISYFLPLVIFIVLVLLFTLNQITVLGWAPASIVFDCNVFSAYRKGVKAVKRHFWSILGTTIIYFFLFWALAMIFGVYSLIVLVPIISALLCVYNMVVFFSSQGMRFYVNENKILTPKKLEEVDNINKTAYIL